MRVRRSRAALCGLILLGLAACTPPGLPAPESPSAVTAGATVTGSSQSLVVGLDGVPTGFNPHAVADTSSSTTAIASLVLPSAFVRGADGLSVRNSELLDSAAVTDSAPFTVTYRLNRDAAWSDGTPITAEDFQYLRTQMLAQVGTIDPAGYRLIDSISSREAGKTVVVTFSSPFPDWPDLFDDLLPAHILKDSPGGWQTGLDSGLPVSGNRYKFAAYDNTAGEISLSRNDKYWGSQPGPAAVVLRIGSDASLLEAFRRGSVQALFLRPGRTDEAALESEIPAARRVEIALPQTVQLLFGTSAGPLADVRVRRGVTAALDTGELRAALSGYRADAARPVATLTALPAAGGPADPLSGRPAEARSALGMAGWSRTGLYYVKEGAVLRLTLRYPSGAPEMESAARSVQFQLGRFGIEVDLVHLAPRDLVAGRFAGPIGGLTLLTVPRGPSDATAAASAFQCGTPTVPLGGSTGTAGPAQSTPATAVLVPTGAVPNPRTDSVSASNASTEPAPRSPVPATSSPDRGAGLDLATANLSGYCDPQVQPILLGALNSGTTPSALDDQLWADLPLLPLGRPTAVFATSPGLASVLLRPSPGWAFTGPLVGLPEWPGP